MARDRAGYEQVLRAVGVCIASRIPFLLWGEPGAGKTAVVESAADAGWHVETLICSHYEPSDFAGLPVVADGRVTLAPPQWAVRVAEHEGPSVVFFDEWTTASPAVQAAALRPLTHGEVGALRLPARVSFGAAANPADVAASGWELAAPTANRFVHLEWALPIEVFTECLVTGAWPRIHVPELTADHAARVSAARSQVAAFLAVRSTQLSAIPRDAASRGRAFPTPRTWDYAARLMAACPPGDVEALRLLVHGAVGAPTGHEFLAWRAALDLPDPESLLADPDGDLLAGLRSDRVHVALQGVLAAVTTRTTPARWEAGVGVCVRAAELSGLDPAVPVVRSLLRIRPTRAALPAGLRVFAGPLALAGLLPA
ncbi:MAG: AAA family ATPase [Candidatus Nanopelagicales bacterium]|jgi:hypothetical protein|nr:AAA family ATPase [Candidatus Nanopelagicales bacterium]